MPPEENKTKALSILIHAGFFSKEKAVLGIYI